MKLLLALTVFAFIALAPRETLAVKASLRLKPENAKEAGFLVAMTKRDDGLVDVTLTRALSQARSYPADSELEIRRTAYLDLRGPAGGSLLRTRLEPEESKETITYRFQVSPDHLASVLINVWEVDDYKQALAREHLLGGGTIFELRLGEFLRS